MWSYPRLDTLDWSSSRVAFYGPMASGKTYLADYLRKERFYRKYSFSEKLKAIAYELYGILGKDGDDRRMLQELGDSLRSFDNDVFSKYTLALIKKNNPRNTIVIDDLRIGAEAKLLKDNGFFLIRVSTPESVRLERIHKSYPALPQSSLSHSTELEWQDIEGDAEIDSSDPSAIVELERILFGGTHGTV